MKCITETDLLYVVLAILLAIGVFTLAPKLIAQVSATAEQIASPKVGVR